MNVSEIIEALKKESNAKDLEGMARFGIKPNKALGTKIPIIRALAKKIPKNHQLAKQLWAKGFRETQILASMVDEVEKVTPKQMYEWVQDFDYWEICDQCCMNLFFKVPAAYSITKEWTALEGEQQKRAGYALMAVLAWKDKAASNSRLETFFPYIIQGAKDDRAPVKKAISWALRSIGKRNQNLNNKAIHVAKKLEKSEYKSAKWVAKDVLKELFSENVQKRLTK